MKVNKHFKHFIWGGIVVLFLSGNAISSGAAPGIEDKTLNYQTDLFSGVENQRGLPVRGMSSKKLLSQYGQPVSRKGPVGNPPIDIWYYDGLNVYFERQWVIATVSKQDYLPVQFN